MNRVLIASVCHAVNAAFCASIGDDSQPAWDDAPQWQKQSALNGVDMHLANPAATPADSHAAWLKEKTEAGWTFGPVKDVEAKLHPCMLPYDELPPEQRTKDFLFRAVVHALRDVPDAAAPTVAPRPQPGAHIAIRYVGAREAYVDGAFGTKIHFLKGQSKLVPADKAKMMLAHPDVYELGEVPADEAPPAEAAATKPETESEKTQDMRDVVNTMTKGACVAHAKTVYQMDLDPKMRLDDMRAQVISLIDRFGILE